MPAPNRAAAVTVPCPVTLASDRTGNYGLAERHGLLDYVLDRFSIAGSPDDCRDHLAALQAAGVENVCLNVAIAPDLPAYLQLFGEHVLPHLQRGPGAV